MVIISPQMCVYILQSMWKCHRNWIIQKFKNMHFPGIEPHTSWFLSMYSTTRPQWQMQVSEISGTNTHEYLEHGHVLGGRKGEKLKKINFFRNTMTKHSFWRRFRIWKKKIWVKKKIWPVEKNILKMCLCTQFWCPLSFALFFKLQIVIFFKLYPSGSRKIGLKMLFWH